MSETKVRPAFEIGLAIDVSPYLFVKNGMKYLPWSKALELLKLNFPDARVEECGFEVTNMVSSLATKTKEGETYENSRIKVEMPYFTDGKTCYVRTRVIIPSYNIDEYCTLPIIDYKNQCIPADKVTMMDVNKALRRCSTKNIAMATGIGLTLWHKEEISESAEAQKILDNIEKKSVLEKFRNLVKDGYDRNSLGRWSKYLFGTANPSNIKDEKVLAKMEEEIDKLTKESLAEFIKMLDAQEKNKK